MFIAAALKLDVLDVFVDVLTQLLYVYYLYQWFIPTLESSRKLFCICWQTMH